ncbi:MAG: hypothetical protein FRX48_07371 [Lasallia pustulata]|uniref:CCHC-type domain-containing protein n=1 Tax=Lasallia pustulata TaxID=136370 RepID=A0A5M8PI15_9LECA|nr:MAG: hypothetical protein FRX48_07371 [Lasallia pustulata]
MSSQQTPVQRPEKTMSSRLMTMKFMQRAAASSAIPSPQTPDHPSAKRRKLSNASSPATSSADLQAIQAALAADEAKRSEAIDRQAAEAGETKWVLSVRDEGRAINSHAAGNLRVVTNGYVDIDCVRGMEMHGEEPWRPLMVGRRSFGKFNRALEKRQGGNEDTSSSSDDEPPEANNEEEDEDDSDDPAGMRALIKASKEEALQRAKAELKARKKAKLAERRKSKEVKLNKLSSISGGGNLGGGGNSNMECFSCGQKGHGKKDCPQRQRRKRGEETDSGCVTPKQSRKS